METKFQTNSFIPKASLNNIVDDSGKIQKNTRKGSDSSSFFVLISFFIFICSAVSAGIIFSLNELSLSQKKSANDSLIKYQKDINKETIEDIKSLNNRLGVINSLLKNHVSASVIFDELSKNTIKQVSFTSFDLKRKADNTFSLVLKAQGVGYVSIIAQDAQFSTGPAQKFFKNTSITDFSKSKGQTIASFGIDTSVSNNVINFSEIINNTPNQ
jgi:hypothetical protein